MLIGLGTARKSSAMSSKMPSIETSAYRSRVLDRLIVNRRGKTATPRSRRWRRGRCSTWNGPERLEMASSLAAISKEIRKARKVANIID